MKIKKRVAAAGESEESRTPKKIGFKGANIAIQKPLLDPNNYRFLDNPGYKPKIKTKLHLPAVQEATIRLLERDKKYQLELKKSILTNGYVPMERIIVVP